MSAAADELFNCAARLFRAPFGGVIILEADGEEPIVIDGRADPPRLTRALSGLETATEGVSVWRGARETLLRALESERQFAGAYVAGRLRITGDMSLAARVSLGA